MTNFYDDLLIFLRKPTIVDPLKVARLMQEALEQVNIAFEVKEYAHKLLFELKQVAREYKPASAAQTALKNQILGSRSWRMISCFVTTLIGRDHEKNFESGEAIADECTTVVGEVFDTLFAEALKRANNEEENKKQARFLQDQEPAHLTSGLIALNTRIIARYGTDKALDNMKVVLRQLGLEFENLWYIRDHPIEPNND